MKNLTLHNYAVWPDKIKRMVMVFGFFLVFVLGYYLIIKSDLDMLKAVNNKKLSTHIELDNEQKLIARVDEYQERIANLQRVLDGIHYKIIDSDAPTDLFADISKLKVVGVVRQNYKIWILIIMPNNDHVYAVEKNND